MHSTLEKEFYLINTIALYGRKYNPYIKNGKKTPEANVSNLPRFYKIKK